MIAYNALTCAKKSSSNFSTMLSLKPSLLNLKPTRIRPDLRKIEVSQQPTLSKNPSYATTL